MFFKPASWTALLGCFVLGSLFPLGFAPFGWWPVTWTVTALYMYALSVAPSTRSALARGWWFGAGLYGVGASWVYISMHDFGYTPAWLAGPLTALFVAGIALFFVLHALFYRSLGLFRFPMLGFPASWILFEWVRTWLLTGFPWLFTGYSVIDSPFAKTAQIGGIFFSGWLATSMAVLIFGLLLEWRSPQRRPGWVGLRQRILPRAVGLAVLLLVCLWAKQQAWTEPDTQKKLNVSLIQGNIPQKLKWDPAFQQQTLDIYKSMTQDEWDTTKQANGWHSDVIIWPEAAVPMFYHQAFDFIAEMNNLAENNNSTLISGVPHISSPDLDSEEPEQDNAVASSEYEIHNSIFAIGTGNGMYHKQRLVPFGEYVPLEKQIRGLIPFFDLPMSSFTPGKVNQKNLIAGRYEFAPFICYEVMYPELVQRNGKSADFLLTVSNDAWFGDSIGPKQHFEMARFRALELGKYLVRGTNTGITAIVDHNGQVVSESAAFQRNTLRGTIYGVNGSTPFGQTGSLPILLLCLVISALVALLARWLRPH